MAEAIWDKAATAEEAIQRRHQEAVHAACCPFLMKGFQLCINSSYQSFDKVAVDSL